MFFIITNWLMEKEATDPKKSVFRVRTNKPGSSQGLRNSQVLADPVMTPMRVGTTGAERIGMRESKTPIASKNLMSDKTPMVKTGKEFQLAEGLGEIDEKDSEKDPQENLGNIKIRTLKNMKNSNFKQTQMMKATNMYEYEDMEVFATRFNPDDSAVAIGKHASQAGLSNGSVEIKYFAKSKKSLIFQTSPDELPVSHIRWKTQNRLLASNVEGYLIEFDIQESNRPYNVDIKIASVKEEDNQILAMDYSSDVLKVCTAGKDANIRLYDDISKRLVRTYEKGNWFAPGHSNRIFSVKFKPDNPNMLISGGWDGAVFLWDIRESKNVAAFCGPNVSGDTIDCKDNTLLIGSHRSKDPLELWDFKTCKKICTVDVDSDPTVTMA
jgi:hypothetical protein